MHKSQNATAWHTLQEHYTAMAGIHIRELFQSEPSRPDHFSREFNGLYVDFSRHRITAKTFELLIALAEKSALPKAIEQLFDGTAINRSEGRSALHTALRTPLKQTISPVQKQAVDCAHDELLRMQKLVEALHDGDPYPIPSVKTVVNIGIGGSDTGPRLVVEALADYQCSSIKVRFVSNVDSRAIEDVFQNADPQTTLFIISSKSFTTMETLLNGKAAVNWLKNHGCDPKQHLFAVTANPEKAKAFGVSDANIFCLWDWVGGRYALWSAVGLPIAINIGMDNFNKLLAGAHAIDEHFRTQPMADNLPVILAMLDIWYINFFHTASHAIVPYDQSLQLLPEYLSQLFMESNGKRVGCDEEIKQNTGAVIWGGVGTNAQHSFFQLLHQGTHIVPIDFILALSHPLQNEDRKKQLFANCLAQGEILMRGTPDIDSDSCKYIPGNKPSTTILLQQLNPYTLGMLLGLYEHRVFVQAKIWDINPFDQWGVEHAKNIAKDIINAIDKDKTHHDPTTVKMMNYFFDWK